MARTTNHAAHAVRRDTFVDVATGLIMQKGYDGMSIQDVLDATGASRGAFYHYFRGKDELLNAVIDKLVDDAWPMLEGIVTDASRPATDKFANLFSGLASFKAERRDLVLAILRVWLSPENAVLRERWRAVSGERLMQLLCAIFEQGRAEGTFQIGDPEADARVIAALMLGANNEATQLFLARQDGSVTTDEVYIRLSAYSRAVERLLGLPPNSTPLASRELIDTWYA
ncbi:MAG TPA: TetR/AcrR family transcriptional regulator [Candidatus Limnocylindrales bacterium]|nr:TetR/AcrR family transcriptional regulator [Candidatus Limnocylindrales bacterium]